MFEEFEISHGKFTKKYRKVHVSIIYSYFLTRRKVIQENLLIHH